MGKWKCWVLFRGSVTSTRLATPPFRAGNGHLFKSESCLLKESFKRAININSLINNAAFHSLSIWNRPPFSFTPPWSCWGGRRGKFLSGAWGELFLLLMFESYFSELWEVYLASIDLHFWRDSEVSCWKCKEGSHEAGAVSGPRKRGGATSAERHSRFELFFCI